MTDRKNRREPFPRSKGDFIASPIGLEQEALQQRMLESFLVTGNAAVENYQGFRINLRKNRDHLNELVKYECALADAYRNLPVVKKNGAYRLKKPSPNELSEVSAVRTDIVRFLVNGDHEGNFKVGEETAKEFLKVINNAAREAAGISSGKGTEVGAR